MSVRLRVPFITAVISHQKADFTQFQGHQFNITELWYRADAKSLCYIEISLMGLERSMRAATWIGDLL